MDSVFLGKMLKFCPGCAHMIVCSVVSMDFGRSDAGALSVLGSLPSIERIPLGRAAWGLVIYLSDERLNRPQQSWVCLLCSMRFSKANYRWLAGGKGKYPLPSATGLVEGLNVCRQLSPLQLTQGREVCEQSLIQCSVWLGLRHLLCWF